MICIKFDQKIKKPKNLNYGLVRFFLSHFPALTESVRLTVSVVHNAALFLEVAQNN